MNVFSQCVAHALRGQLDAQMSFLDGFSRSMLGSAEQLTGLNMQALRTLLVDAATTSARNWPGSGDDQYPMSEAAARGGIDRLNDYHQRLSRISVASQNEWARNILAYSILTWRAASSFSEAGACNVTEEVAEGKTLYA